MESLEKYVDKCIDSMLERYAIGDLQDRVFFALGYMENSNAVKKLLWAIATGEKMVDE